MQVTLELLQKLCPKTKASVLSQYVEPLQAVCAHYDMFDNPRRAAAFLAQIAHESGGFNFVKENLNYSAKGLQGTFKKYFPDEATAKAYERQPERIANRVYANRMKNGDEASGDGYRFCGRGLIQLTGRDNYTKFASDLGISVEDTVAYLETPQGACSSAGWFFDNNNLNDYADREDFVGMTKRINGGTIGLEDRIHHYHLALSILTS